jgi:hypothetical protein
MITQADQEKAVETLQHTAGDGRLPLDEFSERVGTPLIRVRAHGLLGDVYVHTPTEVAMTSPSQPQGR